MCITYYIYFRCYHNVFEFNIQAHLYHFSIPFLQETCVVTDFNSESLLRCKLWQFEQSLIYWSLLAWSNFSVMIKLFSFSTWKNWTRKIDIWCLDENGFLSFFIARNNANVTQQMTNILSKKIVSMNGADYLNCNLLI